VNFYVNVQNIDPFAFWCIFEGQKQAIAFEEVSKVCRIRGLFALLTEGTSQIGWKCLLGLLLVGGFWTKRTWLYCGISTCVNAMSLSFGR
jgi:hypothetical protein